jgi:hypothetical protein
VISLHIFGLLLSNSSMWPSQAPKARRSAGLNALQSTLNLLMAIGLQELNSGSRGSVGLAGMQALKPFMSGLIVSDGKHAGASNCD